MEKHERGKKHNTHYPTLGFYIIENCIMHVISYKSAWSSLLKSDRCSVAHCEKSTQEPRYIAVGTCQINEKIIAMPLKILLTPNRYFEADLPI